MTGPVDGPVKIIKADRIIDGLGGPAREGLALVLQGSRIRSVIPHSQIPDGCGEQVETYEFPGGTALPGLIDCHTHTNMPGDGRKGEEVDAEDEDDTRLARSLRNVRLALETGVTTLCDNGAWNSLGFTLKENLRNGEVTGPRVLVCGNPITRKRGHCWFMGSEAEGLDGVRTTARNLLDSGADFLKVMTTGGSTLGTFPYSTAFSREELGAIVGEARSRGVFTVAHARCTAGISMAVEAGFDMIAHCVFARSDESYEFDPRVAERLIEKGVWVNPTLAIWQSRVRILRAKAQQEKLAPDEKRELAKGEKGTLERRDECRRLRQMGARFVAGSDCGWGFYPFGYFAREVQALGEVGLSPVEAIAAGTSDAARALNIFDKVGSLEAGKEADVLVVRGDPARDLSALADMLAVFKAGQRIETGKGG